MAYALILRRLAPFVLILIAVVWMVTPRASDVAGAALLEQTATTEAAVTTPAGPVVAVGPITGSNGQLDPASLCRVAAAPMDGSMALMQCPAAQALDRLAAQYEADTGRPLCFGNGYRTYAQQVVLERTKPSLAAKAGTSNHGWGLAVDLCGGIERFGTAAHAWMVRNAGAFGYVHPSWAQRGGSRPEPWHWEYGDTTKASR